MISLWHGDGCNSLTLPPAIPTRFPNQGRDSENSSFTKFYKKCALTERVKDTSAEKFYGIKIDV